MQAVLFDVPLHRLFPLVACGNTLGTILVQLQISFLEGIATPSSASKHILELVMSIIFNPLSIIPNRHSDIISDVIND